MKKPGASPESAHPPFRAALRFWLKLGWISFGGPAGQIAIMHEELVTRKRWLSEASFQHALGFCMLLPGPEAQQLATYTGWLLHGIRGGLAAGILFILPGALMLWALSWGYARYGETLAVRQAFEGVQAAVAALVALAVWRMARRLYEQNWRLLLVSLAAAIALIGLQAPFPLLVGAALLAGAIASRQQPAQPDSTRIRISWRAFTLRTAAFLAAGALPLLICAALAPQPDFWLRLSGFFTRAAFVTFGGAYAVLPYVAEVAVQQFQWLSQEEMIHGLALGETTPGPLVLVLAFVGYMAGFHQFGHTGWAALALLMTVWYTFLPSFWFILTGAPLVEQTRTLGGWRQALSWVSAAVTGVMLQLALLLAQHACWGPSGVKIFPLIWALVSCAVLIRNRVPVLAWILLSAAAGYGWAQL